MDLLHTVARRLGRTASEKTMREWCEYAAVWAILKGLGLLPRSLARNLATAVVRILYALSAKLRRTAEVNLRIAFPERSDAQRKIIVRGMLRNLGWLAAELPRFPKYSSENILQFFFFSPTSTFLHSHRR